MSAAADAGTLPAAHRGPRPLRAADPMVDAVQAAEAQLSAAEDRPVPRLRLQREAEIPRVLAAMGAADSVSAASSAAGDGRRPDELASCRQERRQMVAISRIVCQATTEVLAGLRPVPQMSRWLEDEVLHKVRQRAEMLARHRDDSPVRIRPLRFGAERASRLRPGVWEVAVVFHDEQRTRACALRLQAHRRRWRVTAMELG
ncbi:Rv3235 family protein [Nesterenkonia sp.]|uniref:Rv3235 family protein n=1 Tax=Nesterenkonia sp. TaxID=704201 RepID=UPI00260EF3E2|nr:Rv3235 family protein [Nesterenkonia sp.]